MGGGKGTVPFGASRAMVLGGTTGRRMGGASALRGSGATCSAVVTGAFCSGTSSTVSGPPETVVSVSCGFTAGMRIAQSRWTAIEIASQTRNLRDRGRTPMRRAYRRRRMITLPATEIAIPAQVSAVKRKPSNAAERMSATMGTITPM